MRISDWSSDVCSSDLGLWAQGVRPRQHVGILMPSGIEFLETLFAVSMIGGVSVLLNARYKAPELAFVTENADLTTIVTNDEIAEHVNFVERSEEHTSELQSPI